MDPDEVDMKELTAHDFDNLENPNGKIVVMVQNHQIGILTIGMDESYIWLKLGDANDFWGSGSSKDFLAFMKFWLGLDGRYKFPRHEKFYQFYTVKEFAEWLVKEKVKEGID